MSRRPNEQQGDSKPGAENPVRLEEASLIEEIKAGQTERFEELVREYQDRVYNACWRITGHLEDARDITQEAFLRAFQEIRNFRHESSFYTWVFRIAVNLALSHRRKAGRRRTVSIDQTLESDGTQAQNLAQRIADQTPAPEQGIVQAEMHQKAIRALQEIDVDFRIIIVLRDVEGFGYQEISRILDVQPGTVKSRLFRARAALKQAMDSVAHEKSPTRARHD
ncbi:MAG: RNA polymerase sigma factor [Phycisphaerae bacterium]